MTVIKNVYTSIACNRSPGVADWGKNGLIIFGACHAVALCDPNYDGNSAKIIKTFVQHTKRVNAVKWLQEGSEENEKETMFISGSDDSLAILWSIKDLDNPKHFLLKGHESGIYTVDGVKQTNGDWILATSGADSSLKLWNFNGSEVKLIQTIHLDGGFSFAIKLTLIPKTDIILLAFSGHDESISLWSSRNVTETNDIEFIKLQKLTGHEDWVRSLDFVQDKDDLLLASSAQDNFVRLWRIAPRNETQVRENTVDIFNLLDEATGQIRVEEKIVQVGEQNWYAVSLESVLLGHEGWIYGVQWFRTENQELRLLSASIDKSLIVWYPSEEGVWMEQVRVGDVGGNSLGFFGGKFSPDGKAILGHSFHGGFHLWKQSQERTNLWLPTNIIGGHFGEVRDLCWESEGEFVVSVSADQTTRVHGPWLRKDGKEITWHELARPQVHGYDMQALSLISRYTFASGAEEKIIRVFQAPANFIENFRNLCSIQNDKEGDNLLESLPKGASVPSLGLSNKAVFNTEEVAAEEKHAKDEYPEFYFTPVTLEAPPQEENLMQNTLWPEIQKLYGHGYEIFTTAASADGKLLASSCKATNAEHAQVILWDVSTWKLKQKLSSHQLTVTQMSFSPNGQYLLTVSRDRRWSLFEKTSDPTNEESCEYNLLTATDKTNGIHTRIIWSCDWSHDGKYFVTTSRDGKAAVWTHQVEGSTEEDKLKGWKAVQVLELKNESLTAVAFAASSITKGVYLLAIGTETGVIHIYKFDGQFTLLSSINKGEGHHLTVRRLRFRPKLNAKKPNCFELGSCGDDHLVRTYELNL